MQWIATTIPSTGTSQARECTPHQAEPLRSAWGTTVSQKRLDRRVVPPGGAPKHYSAAWLFSFGCRGKGRAMPAHCCCNHFSRWFASQTPARRYLLPSLAICGCPSISPPPGPVFRGRCFRRCQVSAPCYTVRHGMCSSFPPSTTVAFF